MICCYLLKLKLFLKKPAEQGTSLFLVLGILEGNAFLTNRGRQRTYVLHKLLHADYANQPLKPVGMNRGGMWRSETNTPGLVQ